MIINSIKWMGKQMVEKAIIVVFLLIHPEVPDWIKTAIFGSLVFVIGKLDTDQKVNDQTEANWDDLSFADAA